MLDQSECMIPLEAWQSDLPEFAADIESATPLNAACEVAKQACNRRTIHVAAGKRSTE